jgi:hypothetical protein
VHERRDEPERESADCGCDSDACEPGARRSPPAAWRVLTLWWAGSRVLVVGLSVAVVQLGWPPLHWRPGFLQAGGALELLGAWDGRWYTLAAAGGYVPIPGHQSDVAFFPLLPLALRAAHGIGLSYAVAGIVLSNLGFLVGLLALYELGRAFVAEPLARLAAILAAVFPVSFVDSMLYPEGIAFAALCLAGLTAVRRRWLGCAVCCAAFALSRPEGAFVFLPIGAAALAVWPGAADAERRRALGAVLAGPAALGGFLLFSSSVLGNAFAWSQAERAWERSFSALGPVHAVERLGELASGNLWPLRDLAFVVLYVACLFAASRLGVPRAWLLFGGLLVLLPLASGTLESDARFGLLALPVYWGLAAIVEGRRLGRLALVASPLLLAAGVLSVALHSP